jgi:hypothetical protein
MTYMMVSSSQMARLVSDVPASAYQHSKTVHLARLSVIGNSWYDRLLFTGKVLLNWLKGYPTQSRHVPRSGRISTGQVQEGW